MTELQIYKKALKAYGKQLEKGSPHEHHFTGGLCYWINRNITHFSSDSADLIPLFMTYIGRYPMESYYKKRFVATPGELEPRIEILKECIQILEDGKST